ncbi:MAG: hypothetical protein II688_04425, partial [Lachnospiraceae bacterium]|nr:hypothetical protein [Lachnospiraceae bacterium]
IPSILSSEDEIIMRIDKFPTAALELPNKMKVNYREYIQSFCNPDCTSALIRVYPCIDLKKIDEVIFNNSSISDIRKEFYHTMLQKRIERILEPAYEKVKSNPKLLLQKTNKNKKQQGYDT